jgi:hypothetical protein
MYRDIILKILEITDYKEDKDEFLADFNRITNSQALVDLVKTLPEEKREEADAALATADSQEKFTETVNKYFTAQQVQQALDSAAAAAITQWIQSIANTLNDEQRQKLVKLSVELQEKLEASRKK